MRKLAGLLVLAALSTAACGGKGDGKAAADASSASGAAAMGAASGGAMKAADTAGAAKVAAATPGDFEKRTGELSNPDDATMVFLYHDLAGIPAPVDKWVEEDNKVRYAQPIDKAATREEVKAGITAGMAAVKTIGALHLTMNANLSDYDPSYSEFTVRALAPSSVLSWKAFGENVSLKFGNARQAQTWSVPAADAQSIRDRISSSSVNLDALVRIKHVQPGPDGGEIIADVVEYELRNGGDGTTIARVTVTK
ncbi:MAG: hypothetical protein GC155_02560 [Alphaproteobacteria bacterium]|nr:hypothetical protein [Alphaproteobacteria bacterium]